MSVWVVDVALVATNPLDRPYHRQSAQSIYQALILSFRPPVFIVRSSSPLYPHYCADSLEPTAQPRGPFHNLSSSHTTHLVAFNLPITHICELPVLSYIPSSTSETWPRGVVATPNTCGTTQLQGVRHHVQCVLMCYPAAIPNHL